VLLWYLYLIFTVRTSPGAIIWIIKVFGAVLSLKKNYNGTFSSVFGLQSPNLYMKKQSLK